MQPVRVPKEGAGKVKSAVAGMVLKGQANAEDRASAGFRPNPVLGIGFCCYAFYIFAYYSGVLDLIGPKKLHLPAVALCVAVAVTVLSGRFVAVARHPISITLLALTGWLFATVPFAWWPGGTFKVVTTQWGQAMTVFAVGASLTATLWHCRRGLYVIGLATAATALIVSLRGVSQDERLLLTDTRFANSNAIAIILILGLPFLWLLAGSSSAGLVRKVIIYPTMVFAFITLVRTGSRAGMVGLAVLSISVFLRSSAAGKLKVVAAALVFSAAFVVFVPRSLQNRFSTIVQGANVELHEFDGATMEERNLLISAAGSSRGRWDVLVKSLWLTMRHPIFGVGPGNFAPVLADEATAEGRRASWSGSHNTYTQLSAEAGIPGACLFVLALVLSMRELKKVYRRADRIPGKQARDIALMALAVRSSFISYMVCAIFSHLGYELMMPLMCGVAVVISRTAPEELARLERAAAGGNPTSVAASPPAPWPAQRKAMALRTGPVRTS